MESFNEFNISKQLQYAITDLGFEKPTPIQAQSFSVIMSGTDMVGIAQTGTGKTFAYMLPILQDLKFSKETNPRVLVMVPTRELVLQVVEEIEKFGKYSSIRVLGVYGGTNIKGFYVCTGFSGHGFMHGSISGKLMSEYILGGRFSSVDVSMLDLKRFDEGRLIQEYNIV